MTPARRWIDMAAFEMHTTFRELFGHKPERSRHLLAKRKKCIHLAWFFAKQKGVEVERNDIVNECGVAYSVAREAMSDKYTGA